MHFDRKSVTEAASRKNRVTIIRLLSQAELEPFQSEVTHTVFAPLTNRNISIHRINNGKRYHLGKDVLLDLCTCIMPDFIMSRCVLFKIENKLLLQPNSDLSVYLLIKGKIHLKYVKRIREEEKVLSPGDCLIVRNSFPVITVHALDEAYVMALRHKPADHSKSSS